MIAVRRIRPDEAGTLRSLRLASLDDAPDAFGRTYAEEAAYPDEYWDERARTAATDADRATFFAEVGGEPVGMAGFGFAPDGTAALWGMWVRPDARRLGAGRALVDTIVEWAAGTTATSVSLTVTEGNAAAINLYESCGFADTGQREPLREGSPMSTLWMRRELT